jgi:CO/xanthine dehydrogenase FAD-binding subunit
VKPAPFEYEAPEGLDEALALLARHGDEAKVLAGGQSLVPLLALRLARPGHLVDLGRIPGLAYIEERAGELRIGAMTRQAAVERSPLVRARCPLLADAVRLIGHPAIRSRGTIGGSLAHADPAAELPAVMRALGAQFTIAGPRGRREVGAGAFFTGLLTTAVAPDELLIDVAVPIPPPCTGAAFLEVSRRSGDFALVGVAAIVTWGAAGACAGASVALAGVDSVPVEAEEAARLLPGTRLEPAVVGAVVAGLTRRLAPPGDLHASAAYRREVAGVLVRRALGTAAGRARAAA